jgi:hypothetical protein
LVLDTHAGALATAQELVSATASTAPGVCVAGSFTFCRGDS